MAGKVLLVVPEAPSAQAAAKIEQRRMDAKHLRIGTLDNTKSNADHLLRMIVEGLKASAPVSSVVTTRKQAASLPADPKILDQLAAEADVVISAMAD